MPRLTPLPTISRYFPPAERATPSGLVALGGQLSTRWLLDAYRHGIFPWPSDERLLAWWSPDPRAIIEPARFHIPARLWRIVGSDRFEVSVDRDFVGVIQGCATAPGRRGATWLTPAMIEAYCRLHGEGHAHSIECWQNGELVGGVYGGVRSAGRSFFLIA